MADDTLIADLVRAGVSAELVGRVAQLVVSVECLRTSAEATEQRRAKDRERKAKKPTNPNDIPEANDAGINPRISAELPSEHYNDSPSISDSKLEKKKEDSQESKRGLVDGRRGSRLDAKWQPSDDDIAFARDLGLSAAAIQSGVSEFIDYWISIPGQRGTKLDWSATWRNRVRQLKASKAKGNGHGKRTVHDAANDLLDRVRALDEPVPSDLRDGEGQGAVRRLPPR